MGFVQAAMVAVTKILIVMAWQLTFELEALEEQAADLSSTY